MAVLPDGVQHVKDIVNELGRQISNRALASAGIDAGCRMVRDFHLKNKVTVDKRELLAEPLRDPLLEQTANTVLYEMHHVLNGIAERALRAFHETGDQRLLRVHLCVEEIGAELTKSLRERNIVETLDALADGLYVVLGTAVTFALPLGAAFCEVHMSNMSKERNDAVDGDGERVRGKGPNYQPPDIQGVLDDVRIDEL